MPGAFNIKTSPIAPGITPVESGAGTDKTYALASAGPASGKPGMEGREMRKIVFIAICIMLLLCCAATASEISEYSVNYVDGQGMEISVRHNVCRINYLTKCLPGQPPDYPFLEPNEDRDDIHVVEIYMTADEMHAVGEWFEHYDFIGSNMYELAIQDEQTDSESNSETAWMTVLWGGFGSSFGLDPGPEVAPVLRSAQAEFLELCATFIADRWNSPVITTVASLITTAEAVVRPEPVIPDPSRWKEPRRFHQIFDPYMAGGMGVFKSDPPAALLTPVHSPNKIYYYMTEKADFTRKGPWYTKVYIYTEQDQLTCVELADHANQDPVISWINEKLLYIRVWWGRQLGSDLILDVEKSRFVHREMVVDGRILFEQAVESPPPDTGRPIEELERMLSEGTPQEKEAALDDFSEHFQVELIPSVLGAIYDETKLPKQDDTGWGTVHHYAATAMNAFAQRIDGLTLEERGREEYSFHDDGGVANFERRNYVNGYWFKWWMRHKMVLGVR